ncbi:MAG: hypothetical protein ACR2GX_06435 [Candidatus Dormibacteria bacterium]
MTCLIELRCHNVALLRDARAELDEGFGILTGESGSGKSLCISALRFVLGGRIEGDLIRRGADSARVTAVFEPPPGISDLLSAHGVVAQELLTLTRELRSTRSTCRINGSLVAQSLLREVGDLCADITVQGASHRLLRTAVQRRLLDDAGGVTVAALREEMRTAHARWQRSAAELAAAEAAQREDTVAVDAARALLADLGPLQLRAGEEEALAADVMRLRHGAAIRDAGDLLSAVISGVDDGGGVADSLAGAVAAIDALRGVDAELGALGDQAGSAVALLRELALEARRRVSRLEIDDQRLLTTERRLDELSRVRRRHGSIEEAMASLERAERLCGLQDTADLAALQSAATAARVAVGAAAKRLSTARGAAARALESAVEARLGLLEMPEARFRIGLSRTGVPEGVEIDGDAVRCTADGIDDVGFRLAANRGDVPVPLGDGPSGGELSRLALALAAAGAGTAEPVLILDEVDTGIGGETAARVGDVLTDIGRHRQILAVTHRPEIAARAGWHLLVEKSDDGAEVQSVISTLNDGARVAETARLMSGRPTPAALARAEELLQHVVPLRGAADSITTVSAERRRREAG